MNSYQAIVVDTQPTKVQLEIFVTNLTNKLCKFIG
jgi:hypothetical protein